MANHPFDWNTWSGLDATELAQSINEGDVSVPEVMAQLADAVSIQNPSFNAVIELVDDVVETPSTSGANPDGAFYGVPILIKDMGSRIAGVMRRVSLKPTAEMPADAPPPKVVQYTLLLKTGLGPRY